MKKRATISHTLSIIVPLYNEEQNIKELYDNIISATTGLLKQKQITKYEIIFIDDGSNDVSLDILKKIATTDSHVTVLSFKKNTGQSLAMTAGIKEAQYDTIITLDADLQNDPRDFSKLLRKLAKGYDAVCGWRKHRHDPFGKKVMSKIAKMIRVTLINDHIHDEGCTLRAYRSKAIKSINITPGMHRYIPTLLYLKGYNITNCIIGHHARHAGITKYGISRLWKGFMDILYIALSSKNRLNTLVFFIGFMQIMLAAIALLINYILPNKDGWDAQIILYALAAVLLFNTYAFMFFSGIIRRHTVHLKAHLPPYCAYHKKLKHDIYKR